MQGTTTLTAAGQSATIGVNVGARVLGAQVIGAFTGGLTPELSLDGGTTWDTVQVQKMDGTAAVTSVTGPGIYRAVVQPIAAGFNALFRLRAATLTAGTPTVILTAERA